MKRKYKLMLVAGARPNLMKIASIIKEPEAQGDPQITQMTRINCFAQRRRDAKKRLKMTEGGGVKGKR